MNSESETVNVLAVDPGFAAMGVCVIELGPTPDRDRVVCARVIRTEKNASRKRDCRAATDDAERAKFLAGELANVLSLWLPRYVVCEMPDGFGKGARSVYAMGLAKGILCAVASLRGLSLECVTPRAIKLACAGKASASKKEVEDGVMRMLLLTDRDLIDAGVKTADREHVCDAAGAFIVSRGGALEHAARMLVQRDGTGECPGGVP